VAALVVPRDLLRSACGLPSLAHGIGNMDDAQDRRRGGWSGWYLLFVVEVVISLWPPFYNRLEPTWIGIPFFYWYQLLAVVVCAVLTAIVYFATDHD
jgi:hypothetical protein